LAGYTLSCFLKTKFHLEDKKKSKEIKKNKPVTPVEEKQRSTVLMWVCISAITAITYFVFSPSLQNDFTNWDDPAYVLENPLVTADSVQVVKMLETPVSGNYHPVTILSLALNYRFGKLNPYVYHLENLIFHLLNTILVFFFIFLLTRRNLLMAAIVSLFFGIHPMHVESVAWISERKDVLYVFFFMAGLITYLRYRETKRAIWCVLTFLLFILSCLSKGMAVVFPVILLLIDYLRGVKWERKLLFEKIPFFVLSIVFGIIAVSVQQSGKAITAMSTFTVFQRLMVVSYGAIMYIVKFFVPYQLSAFYPYPDIHSPDGIPVIFYFSPFIVLIIIGVLIYFFRRKEKEIVFGLLFYFASVVLVLQFLSVGSAIIADRYSYLSYIGLAFVVAYIMNRALQKKGALAFIKYPLTALVILGAIIFSYESCLRTQVWKNTESLWTNVIDNYPDAALAYVSRGEYYNNENEIGEALADYNAALKLTVFSSDSYKNAHYNRGIIYSNEGKCDSAIADLTKVIEIDPGYSEAYVNRGNSYDNCGEHNLAMRDYSKAIAIDPNNADAYNDRGILYYKNFKDDSALTDLNKAIALNPTVAVYYYNRGLEYKAVNQFQNAITDFTKGLQLNPKQADLYHNTRGLCNISLQNYDDAIVDFSKSIESNPSVAVYWNNRSFAESKIGHNEDAKSDALKGQQLQGK
jgi:tetratricopeptide (TPR) repeat protein